MEASHNGIPPGGLAATKAEVQTAENNAKAYADGLVVGLLDDRGNYDASVNTFPDAGGSGAAGAVKKGDVWLISVAGTLGGSAVEAGDVIRARIDTPGQTAGNWVITERNLGYVPENAANKDASGGYAGLTLFKLNLRNAANTITSWFATAATAARTWTMPDKDGTVAMTNDLIAGSITNTPAGGIAAVTVQGALNELDVEKEAVANKDASGGYVGLEGYKINLWNAAKTFKTMLSSLASATRDAVFPDASGNVAFSGYNNVVTISNLASGGVIGTAANTVDKGLPIQINQTTTAQILTLPTPTNSTSYLLQPVTIPSGGGNVQSLMYDATLIPGLTNLYCYSGGSWNFVGGSVPKHFSGAPAATINPADASTYYFGALNLVPQTTNNASQSFYVVSAGTITSAMVRMWADTAVGTAESISVYIRVNDTTDYLVAAVGSATAARVFSNIGLNIPVTAGDTFSFKAVFPTWATNPTNVSFTARVVVS